MSTVRAKASRRALRLAGRAAYKVLPVICLSLLPCLSACTVDKWCNDLNDYSTLQADLKHCNRKAGVMGNLLPVRINDCMRSLGWYPCEDKPKPEP